jgi:hypothetical protein
LLLTPAFLIIQARGERRWHAWRARHGAADGRQVQAPAGQ